MGIYEMEGEEGIFVVEKEQGKQSGERRWWRRQGIVFKQNMYIFISIYMVLNIISKNFLNVLNVLLLLGRIWVVI